jgi:cysteinyl-tRNA synthetase
LGAGATSREASPEQQRGGSGEASPEVATPVVARVEAFREALADDFNTPRAMAEVFELVGEANRADELPGASVAVAEMLELVGLASLAEPAADGETDERAAELMVEREAARAAKDFARADAIRDELASMGYEIRDSADGPRLVPKS